MNQKLPKARVRLTDDAIGDVHRLHKKDSQIVREIFKKMLLLERATGAGEPLLGPLIGFRKLIVGDRHYRIVWRETTDESHQPVLEIAEVWAVGVRSDGEIYDEMLDRVRQLTESDRPQSRAFVAVISDLGRLYSKVEAHAEPVRAARLPDWLVQALRQNLDLSSEVIATLSQDEAQQLLVRHWGRSH